MVKYRLSFGRSEMRLKIVHSENNDKFLFVVNNTNYDLITVLKISTFFSFPL